MLKEKLKFNKGVKKMPRPRKYDYTKDYPVTMFVNLPISLKEQLDNKYTKKEIESLVLDFLSQLIENNNENG